jgi:hypothetical protein
MNKYIITSISYGIIRNLYYTKNINITEKINDNITEVRKVTRGMSLRPLCHLKEM